MIHKYKIIYGGSLNSQTFKLILVDFFDPDSSIPSSFQKDNSRILFGEGDTPHLKNFIDDFNVFTCLPSSMAEEKGEEWLEYNLKIKTKFPSLIIKMDMTNQEHVNKLGNLFENSVSYCKVNRHGVGPDNDCIFKILKNNGEYDPNYFTDKSYLDNQKIEKILNDTLNFRPILFGLYGKFNTNQLFRDLKEKIEDLKMKNQNIVNEIENYDELINKNDVAFRLALFISLKYIITNINKYKLKPRLGINDNINQDFNLTFTWIKVCSKKYPILCGKKSKNPGYCVIDKEDCNKDILHTLPTDEIKNDYNEKNKDIILRNIFEKNMFILDAFEDLKKNILTNNLFKYLFKNNIFYNISFGFHSFHGVRTIENAEVEILFAFANYKNISLNNNNYFFIKQN